jgi:hypothetical protein
LEGLAETGLELGVESAVEGVEIGAEAALAETGVGIIAAVGLDVIFGAINGAKEAKELDKSIRKLHDALQKLDKNDVDQALNKIKAKIVEEESRFRSLVVELQKIIPKDFPDLAGLPFSPHSIPKFLADQSDALRFYGLLGQLRVTYLRSIERTSGKLVGNSC